MIVKLQRKNSAFHFEASNEDGNTIQLDSSPDSGGEGKGVRPMQLLLMGLGGCSAIDIGLILSKQKQHIDDFSIEINGERDKEKTPALFETIHIIFKLTGSLDGGKVKRAAKLSMEKYCSVAKTLEKTASITYSIEINGVLL